MKGKGGTALLFVIAAHTPTHTDSTEICVYHVSKSALGVFSKLYCGISRNI
jgi:hypothetical protein